MTVAAIDKKRLAEVKKPKAAKPAVEIIAYKAFDKDLSCHGFQYEIGKTYEHKGRVVMCDSGFHSCADPLDVLNYYDITSSRFATVRVGGTIVRKDNGDSKICSASIAVVAELKLPEFIRAAVQATTALCKTSKVKGSVTSGHYATNASSGDYAKNASSGHSAKNASSGHSATNASSGHYATNASSGDYAKNASSGDSATNASSGHSAKNASSGHSATNASSGDSATNASSGDSATNASSGDSATNASSGDYATNASSGDSATNASSGDSATNASSGDYAKNEATGEHSVIAAAGRNTQAKGAKGVWIALPEYKLVKGNYHCIGFATGQAGYDGVPADTWLIAKGGKLVPA
jgi:hypothetical protein